MNTPVVTIAGTQLQQLRLAIARATSIRVTTSPEGFKVSVNGGIWSPPLGATPDTPYPAGYPELGG
jgi:hypothetical protein